MFSLLSLIIVQFTLIIKLTNTKFKLLDVHFDISYYFLPSKTETAHVDTTSLKLNQPEHVFNLNIYLNIIFCTLRSKKPPLFL